MKKSITLLSILLALFLNGKIQAAPHTNSPRPTADYTETRTVPSRGKVRKAAKKAKVKKATAQASTTRPSNNVYPAASPDLAE